MDAVPMFTDALGDAALRLSIGPGQLQYCGAVLNTQCAVLDDQAQGGIAFTDGLELTIGK